MSSAITTALSLYEIEGHREALINSEDLVETPEERAQFDLELQQAIAVSIQKRDQVGEFLDYVDAQEAAIAAKIERHQKLKKYWQRVRDRVNGAIVRTILDLGPDARGRYRKLNGETNILGIAQNPPKVLPTDEGAIPAEFKTLTITVPAAAFETLMDSVPIEEHRKFLAAVRKTECSIDKEAIKQAVTPDHPVPGAEIRQEWRVSRR